MQFIFIHTHPVQYFAPLYRHLVQQGFALQVWYAGGAGEDYTDAEFDRTIKWDIDLLEGYRVRFFPNLGYGRSKGERGFGAYHNPAMISALRMEPPSTVVVHGWSYRTYFTVLRTAKAMGHRVCFRGETNLQMELARRPLMRVLRRALLHWVMRPCDYFLCIGQQSRAFYRYLGFPDKKIVFTPYAVDNMRFRNAVQPPGQATARAALGLPSGRRIFLFAGKFIAKKRPLDILQAFTALNDPQALLVLAGDGVLRAAVETFIRGHHLEGRVLLPGFVNQQSLPLWYHAADVLVVSSDFGETWGLVVNEGMNAGLPLILSDRVGCAADLLSEGENGFGYPCGDVEALAGCMRELLYMAPERFEAMRKASLERVEGYSYGGIEKGLLSLPALPPA